MPHRGPRVQAEAGAWAALIAGEWEERIINPSKLFKFAQVPLWLCNRREIAAGAKLLYGRLITYAGDNGVAFPRQPRLASDLGVSDRQIRRFVAELEGARLVKVERDQYAGPSHYQFLWHPWMDLPSMVPSNGGYRVAEEGPAYETAGA